MNKAVLYEARCINIFKIGSTVIRNDAAGYYKPIVTLKRVFIDFSDRL